MKLLHLSRAEMAGKLGIRSATYISSLCSGRKDVSDANMIVIEELEAQIRARQETDQRVLMEGQAALEALHDPVARYGSRPLAEPEIEEVLAAIQKLRVALAGKPALRTPKNLALLAALEETKIRFAGD